MINAKYHVSYAITLTLQADKDYARYLAEEPDGDKENENYKLSQLKYKKAKKELKKLRRNFGILLKHEELKILIEKAQEKGKKEFSKIQKYVKNKLEEKGML